MRGALLPAARSTPLRGCLVTAIRQRALPRGASPPGLKPGAHAYFSRRRGDSGQQLVGLLPGPPRNGPASAPGSGPRPLRRRPVATCGGLRPQRRQRKSSAGTAALGPGDLTVPVQTLQRARVVISRRLYYELEGGGDGRRWRIFVTETSIAMSRADAFILRTALCSEVAVASCGLTKLN